MAEVLIALNPKNPAPGEKTKVTLVLRHPMEHGIRGDIRVAQVYPDYIYDLEILLGEEPVGTFKLEGSVSSDPLLGFYVIAPETSGELTVRYADHAGAKVETSVPFEVAAQG